MNARKIWILAILFGMIMSILFLILTTSNENNNQTDETQKNEVKVEETENQEEPVNSALLDIDIGKRAITIPVTDISSVSGFIEPGSNVDVVALLTEPIGEDSTSQIILSDIKVLATGKTTNQNEENAPPDPYQLVTLEVTPSQGASLALANELGVLTLMLRNSEDHNTPEIGATSLDRLREG